MRADFDRAARAEIAARDFTAPERAALGAILPFYVDRRATSRGRLLRRRLRARLHLT